MKDYTDLFKFQYGGAQNFLKYGNPNLNLFQQQKQKELDAIEASNLSPNLNQVDITNTPVTNVGGDGSMFDNPNFNFGSDINFMTGQQPQGFGFDPNYRNQLDINNYNAGQDFIDNNPLPEQANLFGFENPNTQFAEGIENPDMNYNEFLQSKTNQQSTNNSNIAYKDTFFNPYGGVNLETALFTLGKSLRSEGSTGNTLRGIGAAGKSLLNIGRVVGAGMGIANREKETMRYYRDKQRKALAESNMVIGRDGGLFLFFKNGGTVADLSPEKVLTGEYMTGLPSYAEDKANSELEVNEYVQHPNGDIQRVVGKTHEEGGEKVNLEEGTRIISDNLQLGADLAKQLKDDYGINTVAKDTYAKAIEKFTNKIGLHKLNEEQEELFKKLNKGEEVKDVSTKNLNKEFLSGKIKEIEDKKASLEESRQKFFNFVFMKQEESKPKEESSLEQFQQGGVFKGTHLKKLLSKYNLSEEEAINLLQQYKKGGEKKYQNGGGKDLEKWIDSQMYKAEYDLGDVQQTSQRFRDLADNAGVKYTDADFTDINSLNNLAGRIQQKVIKDKPELAYDYGLSIDPTRQGLQYLVDKKIVNPKDVGIDLNKGQVRRGSYDTLNEESLKKIQAAIGNMSKEDKQAYALKNYNDNLAYFRGIKTKEQELSPEEYRQFTEANKDNLLGNGYYKTKVAGVYVKPTTGETVDSTGTPIQTPDLATPPISIDPNANINPIQAKEIRQRLGILMLPDQSALPPDALQPHLKIQRRYERLDPVKISPEEQIKEINRTQDFAVDNINNLPDSQRRAVLASMTANSQENINKAISQTNMVNAQNFQQTEQFNIGQSNAEENARAQDMLDFERRQLTALAKTQADIFNYFDYNRKIQLGNFNTVNRANLLNDIFENYNFDGNGIVVDRSNQYPFVVQPNISAVPTTANVNNNKKN